MSDVQETKIAVTCELLLFYVLEERVQCKLPFVTCPKISLPEILITIFMILNLDNYLFSPSRLHMILVLFLNFCFLIFNFMCVHSPTVLYTLFANACDLLLSFNFLLKGVQKPRCLSWGFNESFS